MYIPGEPGNKATEKNKVHVLGSFPGQPGNETIVHAFTPKLNNCLCICLLSVLELLGVCGMGD